MKKLRPTPTSGDLANAMYQNMAGALTATELSMQQRDRMRERMLQIARDTSPEGTVTIRAASDHWVAIAPMVEMKVLRCDERSGTQTVLVRMQPGSALPAHRHLHEEEFFVIEGECYIGTHRLGTGDVHIAGAGSFHDEITTESGVLVLLRGEYPTPSAFEGCLR